MVYLENYPRMKRALHRVLVAQRHARPRWWVRFFLQPFYLRKDRGSTIGCDVRLDLFPFQKFSLGAQSVIEDRVTLNNGAGPILIGDDVMVGIASTLIGPVEIGNHVLIAQNVVMSGVNHSYEDIHRPINLQGYSADPIRIGDECWIGANAVITAGVTIGKHSVVGAGSVVIKDVPDYTLVAGNPATVKKHYDVAARCWISD